MKAFKIIVILFFSLFLLLQTYMIMATNRTEQQKFRLVQKDKDIEIRFYPASTFATIQSNAKTYRDLSYPGFRKLAGYIFGGNESNTQISMTSPVHMDVSDSVSTMSFVMPSSYNSSNLPKPKDSNVRIVTNPDEYVAVIRFGGYTNDKKLKYYSEKLKNILIKKGIKSVGHYRFLGYNPPYQLFGRRNEVIVSVEWKE